MYNSAKWETVKALTAKHYNIPLASLELDRETGIVKKDGEGFAIFDHSSNKLYRFGFPVSFDCWEE